ncbi:MAG: DUF1330 domain-containing protein [Thermoanaerobaculia bacterium]
MTIYYTQLIFIRAGEEQRFLDFESQVLPLLAKHNGQLLYRARPSAAAVVESTIGQPYEVHLISFGSRADFDSYAADPERQWLVPEKDASVHHAILIEGSAI